MTTISADAVLVSRNAVDPDPNRKLATVLTRYPRWIHAELMTHRAFSRNAASSRAIPVTKMIRSVLDDPAVPLFWGKNQKGMQASEECTSDINLETGPMGVSSVLSREEAWLHEMRRSVAAAGAFAAAGYHKQVVNRLLEPFMHITVVISATQWSNFFALRIHKDAEPHIRLLAEKIKAAIDGAPVQVLKPGSWHLPFVTDEDKAEAARLEFDDGEETRRVATGVPAWEWYGIRRLIKISVARCASTSYKTVDGFDMTPERAAEIHDKLVASAPMHASPCEHAARAAGRTWLRGDVSEWIDRDQHRNFVGWCQYRASLPGECQ